MPPGPTVQTGAEQRRPRPGEQRRSELVCRVKYSNTLPDIPFDPKFLSYPFDSNRFINYNPTSLERSYKYEMLTEPDLGVHIELIDPKCYAVEPGMSPPPLHPSDEKLLEEDTLAPQDTKRSRHHAKPVSWLRRTEYISTEKTPYQPQTIDKAEAKVGYKIKKKFKEENMYMDRESQIKAIDKTFSDAKKSIKYHYSKPGVTAVEVHDVFPDFQMWKYPCAQVIFDSDPAPIGKSQPAQVEEMTQAMIRGVMDESGEQFVAYFLPTDDTLEKRRKDFANDVEYEDEQEYEYMMAREYNWNVKNKASKGYEENYFFVFRKDGVYFDELETRVRLSKRRQKVGAEAANSKLIVRHRPQTAREMRVQRYRERQLEPPGEDEEEELEDEQELEETVEQEPKSGDEASDEGRKSRERSRSRSGSRSSRSSSRASSKSGKRSRSGSRSPARSKSRSKSRSRSRSRSRSKSRGSSRSRSGSRSSRSGSRKSRSSSRGSSKSKSKSRSPSGSPVRSKSRSKSRSPSRSRSKSREQSRSRSGSRSSRSGSRKSRSSSRGSSKSGDGQKGSRSPSPARRKSPSKSRSRSRSRSKSRSRSGSPAHRSRSSSRSSRSRSSSDSN